MGRYKHKKITIEGKLYVTQGYEHFFLKSLASFGLCAEQVSRPAPEVQYVYRSKKHRYQPDFYVESTNTLIEIKSLYTLEKQLLKNYAKFAAARAAGYKMWIIVYNAKGIILAKWFT